MKKVLVVAAHTDDEAIGCGGTIARYVAEGNNVQVVFMADGITSRPGASEQDLQQRQAAADKAQAILGYQKAHYLGLPDNRLDSVPLLDVVQPLEKIIRDIGPEVVYTHHSGDLNVDHRITHQAVLTACRPIPGSSIREIYGFEVVSSTEWNTCGVNTFAPQVFVDISDLLENKLAALDAYRVEIRTYPHSRSLDNIKALALHRGCAVGLKAAEAYMMLRFIKSPSKTRRKSR